MASPIIRLFCGNTFDPSILTLQIIVPVVIFIPLSNIFNMQILYSLGKEKLSIISVSIGAIINFMLNLYLIPIYSQYGAAVATITAEFIVMLLAIIIGRRYISLRIFSKQKIHYCLASAMILVMLLILKQFDIHEYVYLIIGTITAILIYYIYLWAVKDEFFVQIKAIIISKVLHK